MPPIQREAAVALPIDDAAGDFRREFAFSDADFRGLAQLAYEHAGIALADSKRNLVYSRLSRRLRALGMSTFQEYRQYLAESDREIESFINSSLVYSNDLLAWSLTYPNDPSGNIHIVSFRH